MKNLLVISFLLLFWLNGFAQYGKERAEQCSNKKEAYLDALVKAKMKDYKKLEESLKVKINVTEGDIRKAGECSYNRLMKDIDVNCEYFMDLKSPKIYNHIDYPCETYLPDMMEIYQKIKHK